jgi:hypothetical protein
MPPKAQLAAKVAQDEAPTGGPSALVLETRNRMTRKPDRARLMRLSIVCGGILTVFPIDFARRGQFGC